MRLWAPLEVRSLAASREFYESIGLPMIDGFDNGEVFAVGDGRIEIVQTRNPGHRPPIAIEVASWEDVGADGKVFPRGHYGRYYTDPDGHQVLIWSERR
jgi:predicted lactoylglutathione lyase